MELVADRGVAIGRLLDAAENASPVEAVEAVTRELGQALGATDVAFLIMDLSGRALVRLAHVPLASGLPAQRSGERRAVEESATVLPFDGGPMEKTLSAQEVRVLPPGTAGTSGGNSSGWTVLAPVTERGEALGLLELSLPDEPGPAVLTDIARTAHLLSFVVIANRRHTDLFEWGQRSRDFNLYAEIQRRMLPSSYTCEAGAFTLSAWLEPAATIGGDTFDYSLDRDVLHLSMTDAMGHGLASALTATLCVSSLRNSRRVGMTLLEQVTAANTALYDSAQTNDSDAYATGIVGRVDLRTGVLSLVNAGHTEPYLSRAGVGSRINPPICAPLGMFRDTTYTCTSVVLQPGDRLAMFTDGMLERRAEALDLESEMQSTRALHPREVTRRLADRVLEVAGPTLEDDATLLILDWHGEHEQGRDTESGADSTHAPTAPRRLELSPEASTSVRLPLSSESAREARRVVAAALTAIGRTDLTDDANTVVSELVANAVMHARTPMELSVEPAGAGVRISISDGSPILPRWTPASATATSGRGLFLVERLCSSWGAQPIATGGKTVWAFLEQPSTAVDETSAEDLLTMWSDEPVPVHPPPSSVADVPLEVEVAVEIEVATMLESRAHSADLTRELQLILLREQVQPVPVRVQQLATELTAATQGFYEPRRQMYNQTLRAAQRGDARTTLRMRLAGGDAAAAQRWLAALDEADTLTTQGILLLPPFPPAMVAFRRHYIATLIAGLPSPG